MLSKSMDVLLGEELTGKKKSGEKRKRNNVNGADQTGGVVVASIDAQMIEERGS